MSLLTMERVVRYNSVTVYRISNDETNQLLCVRECDLGSTTKNSPTALERP